MNLGDFASFINMNGERMCTALNDTVIYDSNEPVTPDGYLITATADNFVDNSGNKFVYVQFP